MTKQKSDAQVDTTLYNVDHIQNQFYSIVRSAKLEVCPHRLSVEVKVSI